MPCTEIYKNSRTSVLFLLQWFMAASKQLIKFTKFVSSDNGTYFDPTRISVSQNFLTIKSKSELQLQLLFFHETLFESYQQETSKNLPLETFRHQTFGTFTFENEISTPQLYLYYYQICSNAETNLNVPKFPVTCNSEILGLDLYLEH